MLEDRNPSDGGPRPGDQVPSNNKPEDKNSRTNNPSGSDEDCNSPDASMCSTYEDMTPLSESHWSRKTW